MMNLSLLLFLCVIFQLSVSAFKSNVLRHPNRFRKYIRSHRLKNQLCDVYEDSLFMRGFSNMIRRIYAYSPLFIITEIQLKSTPNAIKEDAFAGKKFQRKFQLAVEDSADDR